MRACPSGASRSQPTRGNACSLKSGHSVRVGSAAGDRLMSIRRAFNWALVLVSTYENDELAVAVVLLIRKC